MEKRNQIIEENKKALVAKKVKMISGICLGVIVLLIIMFNMLTSSADYKSIVKKQLEDITHGKIRINDVNIHRSFLPPKIRIDDVKISYESVAMNSKEIVVNSIEFEIGLFSLFSDNPEINSVKLISPLIPSDKIGIIQGNIASNYGLIPEVSIINGSLILGDSASGIHKTINNINCIISAEPDKTVSVDGSIQMQRQLYDIHYHIGGSLSGKVPLELEIKSDHTRFGV